MQRIHWQKHVSISGTHGRGSMMLALLLLCAVANAAPVPSVVITQARVRLLPGNLPLAGYFTLTNDGSAPVTLTGAISGAFKQIMMHRSFESDGMSKMAPVAKLTIQPRKSVHFRPGSYHLMLMGRQQSLSVGDTVPIQLQFKNSGALTVEFKVVPVGAQ